MRKVLSCLAAAALVSATAASWAQTSFQVNDGANRGTCTSYRWGFTSGVLELFPAGCLAGSVAGPVFSFAAANPQTLSESYAAGLANRPASFAVQLDRNGSTSAHTVDVEICPSGSGCTAVGGLDFQLDSSYTTSPPYRKTLSFAPGETNRTFDIHIVDDAIQDGGKSLTFGLANASGGATIGSATSSVLLSDDDAPVTPSGTVAWALGAFAVSEADAAGVAALPINRTSTSGTATVQVEIPATGTTAVVGSHYNINDSRSPFTGSPPTTTVEFANGAATAYVFLPIINNTTDQASKTVALTLKGPVGATLGATPSTVLTIANAGSTPGVDYDVTGAPIPDPTGVAAGCEFPGSQPFPGTGTGPCGSYEVAVAPPADPGINCSNEMVAGHEILKAWQYNLAYNFGAVNSLRLGMQPRHVYSYRFKTPTVEEAIAAGQGAGWFPHNGSILTTEQANRGGIPAMHVTLSEKRCDFRYAALIPGGAEYDVCHKTSNNALVTFSFQILGNNTDPDVPSTCTLRPGKYYYLNVRFENPAQNPGTISCLPGTGYSTCGFSFQIN